MSENNIVGEFENKKAFVGQHDSAVRVGSNGGANISQPSLDAEQEYNVGRVGYHNGGTTIISTMTADTTNSDTNTLDTTASEENRSAKYKYPNVSQDTSQMPPSNGEEPRI